MKTITLYNTRTRKKEVFIPRQSGMVGMYTCGPTVYNYMQIGNLRSFLFADVLRRVLLNNGYTVNHVMNITDVGHLTDDADQGEDKMEKGAKREGKTAWDIASFYTKAFLDDSHRLNLLEPTVICKATDHIAEQITQVQQLIDRGYTYETSDGIYFDTTKLDDYGKLAQLDKQELQAGARIDIGEKKHPNDFALWKRSVRQDASPERSGGSTRQMEWIFNGKQAGTLVTKDIRPTITQEEKALIGFPGWHIECSAMSMKYLGDHFDIHTGGIDHIPVHHTNEIAQAEAILSEKPWVTYWLHNAFLTVDGEKMSKSKNNFYILKDIVDKGYDPLSYRYFLLQTHYRKPVNFTWDAIAAADKALKNLRDHVQRIGNNVRADISLKNKFTDAVNDDLNTAEALAVLWHGIRSDTIDQTTVAHFDTVLGINLVSVTDAIPHEIQVLLDARQRARKENQWEESDRLRDELNVKGYLVEDTEHGQRVIKK